MDSQAMGNVFLGPTGRQLLAGPWGPLRGVDRGESPETLSL